MGIRNPTYFDKAIHRVNLARSRLPGLAPYRVIDGRRVMYTQEPIANERWTNLKRNATDPDYGCYSVTYTLSLADANIELL